MPRKKLRKAVDSVKADKTGTGGDGKEGIGKAANNEKHVETGEEGNLVQVEIGEDNKGANLEQGNTQLIVIIDNRAAEQEIETGKVNDNADGGDSTVGKHQKENLKQETKTDGTNTKLNVNMEAETSSKEKDIAELVTRADDIDKKAETSSKEKEKEIAEQQETGIGSDNVDNGAQTSLDSAEDEEYLEDVRVCDTCGDVGQEHNLVNCHRCDSGAEHIYCMREKLEVVPEDPWTCFTCIQKDRERERAQRVSSLRNSNKDVVQEKQQKQEVSSSLERKDEVSPKNVVSEVVEQKGKEDGETNNVINNKGAEENKDTPLKRKADVLPSPVKPQPNKLLKTASSKTLSPKPGIGVNGKQAPQPLTKTGAPVNGKRVPPPSPKVTNAKGLPEKEKVNPAVPKKTVQPLSKPANGKPNVSKSSIPTPKPAKHGALDVAAIQAMQESLLKSSKPKAPQAKKEDPLARTTATTKWKDSGKDEKATMKNVSQAKQTEDVHGKTELLKPTLSKASSFKQAEDGHGKSDLLKPTVPRTSSFKQTEDVHGKTDSLKPTLSKTSSIKQTEDVHGKIDSSKPTLSKTNSFKETKEDVPEYAAPQRKCYKCNGFGHSVLYCPSGAMKLLTPFLDSRQSDTQSPLPRLPLPSPLPGLLPTPTKALPTALQSSRPLSTQVPVAVTSTSLQLGVTKAPSAQLQTTPAATPSPLRNEEGRPETKENPIAPPKTVSNSEKIADNEDLPPGYAAHNLDEELSSRRKDRSSRERDRSPDWKRRERDRYHRSGRDKERRSRRPYRRSRSRSSERKRDRRRERSKSRSRTPPRRHDPGRTRYRSSSPSRSDSSDGQRKTRSKSRSPSRRHDRRRSPSEPRRKHSTRHRRSRSRSPGRRRERSRSKSRSRSPTRSPRKSVEPVYHNFLSVEPATAQQEILPAPDLNLVPEIYENPKGGLNLELVPPTDHSIELSLAVPQYRQMGNSWVKVAEEEKDSVKDWALNLGL